ncbi:hypothetical protein M9H77_04198 [Catharanthus roseus]|uniref:Uncharacterized protein n=1 Tax=Catharanthus roseus TaxID=4058 RepID=A0ACC0CDG1_CATRO|nr:hypothetical protein M9H77_04198 [Catharanthus roseus]
MNMMQLTMLKLYYFGIRSMQETRMPYFTGAATKTWTFTQMVTHDELIRKILKHQGMDPNLWQVRMTMRVPSFYEEYQIFNFTMYSMNNDDKMCYLWTINPNISKGRIHIHQGTHMPRTGSSKQALKFDFKICFKTNITSCCQQSRIPVLNVIQEVQVKLQTGFVANGENIYCLVLMLLQSVEKMVQDKMLMCRIYIYEKLIEEHTNPILSV